MYLIEKYRSFYWYWLVKSFNKYWHSWKLPISNFSLNRDLTIIQERGWKNEKWGCYNTHDWSFLTSLLFNPRNLMFNIDRWTRFPRNYSRVSFHKWWVNFKWCHRDCSNGHFVSIRSQQPLRSIVSRKPFEV